MTTARREPDGPTLDDGLACWLQWIESRKGFRVELGLDRVRAVWNRLNPSNASVASIVFTVAGTNGKGSTCHALEALAMAHGYRVGLYTSPHLIRFNERCRIGGDDVSDELLVEAFCRVKQASEGVELTYFEFTTVAILWVLMTQSVDVAILEVGLGGRLDAVNCVDANVGIVTSIHFDHAAFLGNDLASVAAEKAGIARANRPLVIAETKFNEAQLGLLEGRGVQVWLNGRDFYVATDGYGQPTWSAAKPIVSRAETYPFDQLSLPVCSVMPVNLGAALQAWMLAGLRCDRQTSQQAFATTKVPGRQQWCRRRQYKVLPCDCLVDVAHNTQSAQALAGAIATARDQYARVHSVVGLLCDKLDGQLLAPIAKLVDEWSVVPTPGERGVSAQQMLKFMNECGVDAVAYDDTGSVWERYFSSQEQVLSSRELIVIWGSFHIVGPFLHWLQLNSVQAV